MSNTPPNSPLAELVSPLTKLLEHLPKNSVLRSLLLDETTPSRPAPIDGSDPSIAPIGFTRSSTRLVERSFGFIDIASFTNTVSKMNVEDVTLLMSVFRTLVREVAAARGCRIGNWMGDGVLIIGVDPTPLICTIVEITVRLSEADIPVCSGVTTGEVLLFEGDEYVGTPLNLASRLSDAAIPGQILADKPILEHLPDWIASDKPVTAKIKGLGRSQVYPLEVIAGKYSGKMANGN